MADENNPVHKINQPITPQIQSSQPQTFQSSDETLLNDTVRNIIHHFNASGAHPPKELV